MDYVLTLMQKLQNVTPYANEVPDRPYLAVVVGAGLIVHGLIRVDLRNDSDQRVPLRLGICGRQLLFRHDQLCYGGPLLCSAA